MAPKGPRSITVTKMLELINLFASQINQEREAPLSTPVTSHDLQQHFKKHNILPTRDYADYFSDEPPEVALTYEWNTDFVRIKALLQPTNVAEHNRSLNLRVPLLERCYLMSGAWACLGPLSSCSLPADILQTRIWIDILFNSQLSAQEINAVLEAAEEVYRAAARHLVLGTRRVLSRAWCLYELAVRKEAGKTSQILVLAEGAEGGAERGCGGDSEREMMPSLEVGLRGSVHGIVFVACVGPHTTIWLCNSFFKAVYCKDVDVILLNGGKDFLLAATVSMMDSESQEYIRSDFFGEMEASVEGDKAAIQRKILDTFQTPWSFNFKLVEAAVKCKSSYLIATLLLWLELLLLLVSLPIGPQPPSPP